MGQAHGWWWWCGWNESFTFHKEEVVGVELGGYRHIRVGVGGRSSDNGSSTWVVVVVRVERVVLVVLGVLGLRRILEVLGYLVVPWLQLLRVVLGHRVLPYLPLVPWVLLRLMGPLLRRPMVNRCKALLNSRMVIVFARMVIVFARSHGLRI